jgi:hypothetical protein
MALLSRDAQVFAGFLALCATGAGFIGVRVWTRPPLQATSVQDLPSRVVQVAFGVDELDLTGPVDTAPPDLPVRVTVGDLHFLGSGDWVLASALVERHADELGVCYLEQPADGYMDTLQISVSAGRATPGTEVADAACVLAIVDQWAWPRDLTGTVTLELRAGALI